MDDHGHPSRGGGPRESDPTGPVLDDGRDPLDHLAEEFVDRCRRGESPAIAEYEARFPDRAEQVRKLLSAAAMMEQLRRGSRQARFLPERIGEFRILRELGRGGMGVVYEAVQESLWRHVAVKAIHHTQLDPKRLQRFRREAQAVAQLHHTSIVPIFGVGEHEGIPYYAMQYIRGRGLDALLASWKQATTLPAAERWRIAARYAAQAAGALDYAHEQGVLHRDIKPANLLIDEHDAVWVTDFGLAKMVGHDELTASGDVIGTLRYLAPESLRGISDGRGDVYSLGLTLYEMLTLAAPFGDLSPSELLHRVGAGSPARPRQVDPGIPRDLETIVLKATAREPADRYATAGALAFDLQCFLNDRPILARRATFPERAWRWSRRNRGTAALLALAATSLLLAAVAGWAGYVARGAALAREQERVAAFGKLFKRVFDALYPLETAERPGGRLTQPVIAAANDVGGGGRPFRPGPDDFGFGPGPGWRDDPSGPGPVPGHGPGAGDGANSRAASLDLQEQVMAEYDEFARSQGPDANPQLRGEAAWVHFKMGSLYERLGRQADADRSFHQTLTIFADLAARHAGDPTCFPGFFKVCEAIQPRPSDPARLAVVERRLEYLQGMVDRLLVAKPGDVGYRRAKLRLLAKLGVVRYQRRRPAVEEMFRAALALADGLVADLPEAGEPRSDRADVLDAYAQVLIAQGHPDQARARLDAALDDLEWVADDGLRSAPLADQMERVADLFEEQLGDPARADRVQRRADEIDPRAYLPDRPKLGRPLGPRPDEPDAPADRPGPP